MSLEQRFWQRVAKSDEEFACWEWTGELNSMGYGRVTDYHNGQRIRYLAHRFSLRLALGELFDEQLVVMHTCDNTRCVRPDHLKQGSQRDNIADMHAKGRADVSGLAIGQRMTADERRKLVLDRARGIA